MSTVAIPTNPEPRTPPHEYSKEQMRDYLSDLEAVLRRIDSGRTYYQILGVDRTDDQETLRTHYQRLLDLLYPPYTIASTMPAEVPSRVERAFAKISQAFGVLASFARRKEYDSALLSTARKPRAQASASDQHAPTKPVHSGSAPQPDSPYPSTHRGPAAAAGNQNPNVDPRADRGQVLSESSQAGANSNRRRCGRMKLAIPVRVTGHDQVNGKWNEMAETLDVSRTGAKLRLHRRVKHGTVLFLTLPMPSKLRAHGFAEQGYNVYVLVRTVEPPRKGRRTVGVEFLGERPPAGFIEKPWAVYRAKRGGTAERRRHRREERNETVTLHYLDENGQSIGREEARSENISSSGLRIVGTAAPSEFDLIAVNCPRLHFEAMAVLRDRYRGKDGLERLCLNLIDKEWPSR